MYRGELTGWNASPEQSLVAIKTLKGIIIPKVCGLECQHYYRVYTTRLLSHAVIETTDNLRLYAVYICLRG